MATPAPAYNFASIPSVPKDNPLWNEPNIPDEAARGRYWLAEPLAGRRLTMSTDMISGRPENVIVLPGSSWWPLASAVGTGGFFLFVLLKQYGIALAFLALAVLLFLCWAWATGSRQDMGSMKAHEEVALPFHYECPDGAPGWHGLVYTLVADAAILGSLIFGMLYLWLLAPAGPPEAYAEDPWWAALIAAVGWLAALVGNRLARGSLYRDEPHCAKRLAQSGLGLHAIAVVAVMFVICAILAGLPPSASHAQSAVTAALLWYAIILLGISLIMAVFLAVRWFSGFVSASRYLEPRVVWLFSHYSMGSAVLCLVLASLPGIFA